MVLFIHRPDQDEKNKARNDAEIQENVAEIIIAKNRSGPQGVVKMYFKGECTKFIDLDESGEPIGVNIYGNARQEQSVKPLEDEKVETPDFEKAGQVLDGDNQSGEAKGGDVDGDMFGA